MVSVQFRFKRCQICHMAEIVLTTLNARYWHTSFGLRYLLANMGELSAGTKLMEFTIGDRPLDIVEAILAESPRIVGIGIYIWNTEQCLKVISDLRKIRPDVMIVAGGPEISYCPEDQACFRLVDYIITGEADLEFPKLCRQLLLQSPMTGVSPPSVIPMDKCAKVIHAPVPALEQIAMPYHLYDDNDIAHRTVYVEVSRGCPFTCEFCLSALDIPVRLFDVDSFLAAMQQLLDRGVRQFKFVDRTFNLNLRVSNAILQFFLDRWTSGLFLHFEMIPDRLPESLRQLISQFPPGTLQFEIGVQTFHPEVGELISRRQDNERLEDNFRYLRQHTGVHIHADLIVGLPGESEQSFASGFDRLVRLNPQEIQIGILKRLKGTPIIRHDADYGMVYSEFSPFEILSTSLITFESMQRLRRFARIWDLVSNSGNFVHTHRLLWDEFSSPYQRFSEFSDWLFAGEQRVHGIPLGRLAERLFTYLTERLDHDPDLVANTLWRDYVRGGRKDKPAFLTPFHLPPVHEVQVNEESTTPARQSRHLPH